MTKEYSSGHTATDVIVASWLTEARLARRGQKPQLQLRCIVREWRCKSCRQNFQALDLKTLCPNCRSADVKRIS